VGVERGLDQQIAGGDADPSGVADLIELTGDHGDRVGMEVLVAASVVAGRQALAAPRYDSERRAGRRAGRRGSITSVQDAPGGAPHDGGMRCSVRPPRPWSCAIVLASAVGCASAAAVRAPGNTEAVLRAQTQELLDAIAVGNAAVWDRYVDPRILYVSEAGEVEGKAQLLAELKPLPAGVAGKIALGRFEVRQHGDTAVVLHVDEEDEDYFGHPIHAQYLTTATWRLGPDGWKLIATQALATLLDPPAIALPAAQLDEYAGTYQLTEAIRYTVRRDGDRLIGERTGRPAQELRVEARDVLFVPGQPRSRKVFQRDASGRITGFADRREARDVVWTRLP
jgi:hypothetical protein